MEATPILKRRKLNAAVHKPFKSPLRSLPSQPQLKIPASPLSLSQDTNLATREEDNADELESRAIQHSGPHATPLRYRAARTIPRTTPSLATSPGNPEIQEAIKEIRALESALLKTRQEVDSLNQALRLVTSSKDAELDALIVKWRRAAREAAEEVFAGARDKVNSMGGVGAWREKREEMTERFKEWNEAQQGGDDEEEEIYDEDGELVEVVRREREREDVYEDEWDYDVETRKGQKHEEEEGRDDDSFTMDMMLKMLNIDLTLIGYDKRRQRWIG